MAAPSASSHRKRLDKSSDFRAREQESHPNGFQFINLDSQSLDDPSSKKVVRSHVMQRYRQSQAQKQADLIASFGDAYVRSPSYEKSAQDQTTPNIDRGGHCLQCRKPLQRDFSSPGASSGQDGLKWASLCTSCQQLMVDKKAVPHFAVESPSNIIGFENEDPFDSLPLPSTFETTYLIDHYSRIVLGLCLPMTDPQIRWLKFSLNDGALLNCLLLYAAQHNQIMTGVSRQVDVYHYRGEVIRIINERLTTGEEGTSDTTIDAITCLVRFEEMFGLPSIAAAHRAGLEQIVRMRGGLKQLNPSLQEVIGNARQKHSLEPIWQTAVNGQISNLFLPQNVLPLDISMYVKPELDLRFDNLGGDMIEIFCRLRNSSMLVSSVRGRRGLISELEQNEQYLLRGRIEELLNIEFSKTASLPRIAWLIAAIIYTSTVLSEPLKEDMKSEVMGRLMTGLQVSILQEHPSDDGGFYPSNVMLWMLLIGGLNAENAEMKGWFSRALAGLSKHLKLQQWPDVKLRLRDFPWSYEIAEMPSRRLWTASVTSMSPAAGERSRDSSEP